MLRKLLLLLSFIPLISVSQKVEVLWGDVEKLDNRREWFRFLGDDDTHFYLEKEANGNGSWTLERHFLDSLKIDGSVTIPAPELGDGEVELLKLLFTGKSVIMLHSLRDSRSGKRKLFLTPLNTRGELIDIPTMAGEVEALKRREAFKYDLILSPDSSKVLLSYTVQEREEDDAVFDLDLFTIDLERLNSKTLVLPYPNRILKIDRINVDNTGNVFMLSGVAPRKTTFGTPDLGDHNKRYLVFSYSFHANKLKEFDVNLKDKWVVAVTMGMTPDNALAIGGFYSNDMYFSIAGTFYFTINTVNWRVRSTSMQPFDKAFLKSFGSSRQDEGGRELFDYYFDHFILNEDGSARIVAEQFYVSQRIFMDPGTGRQSTTYSYNYNDIIVVAIDTLGKIDWSTRIPKRQMTMNDNGPYSSYALAYQDGAVDVVFNDNPRNFELLELGELEDPASYGNLKKSVVTWVRVDQKGNKIRKPLFAANERETLFKPKASYQLQKEKLLVFSQLRKDFRFIKLSFPSGGSSEK